MSDQKISQLPAATLPLAGAEPVALVQGGETRQAPASAFGGGGWTQIGSDVPTTSGTAVTFANIPPDYSDLIFEFVGVSGTINGDAVAISVSGNGINYTPTASLQDVNASAALHGLVFVMGYRRNTSAIIPCLTTNAPVAIGQGSRALRDTVHRLDTPVTHVRFGLIAGGTFDAGLIRLFGR